MNMAEGVVQEMILEYEQAINRCENLLKSDLSEPTKGIIRARRTAYRGFVQRLKGELPEDIYHLP